MRLYSQTLLHSTKAIVPFSSAPRKINYIQVKYGGGVKPQYIKSV